MKIWFTTWTSAAGRSGRRTFNADGSPRNTEVHWYVNVWLRRTLRGIRTARYEHDAKGNWVRKVLMIQPSESAEAEVYTVEYRGVTYH